MLESLRTYLAYPFVRYALVAGVMIALCSSLLGVTLVLKRFSLIGDGLSHVAFGALAVASVLRLTAPMIFVLPATVLCAVALLCASQNSRIRGDASIAMLSVGSLAIGYLLLNLFGKSSATQSFRQILQSVGRCLHDIVRFDFHSDAFRSGRMALRDALHGGGHFLHPVL